jgi:hypothetical protein
VPAQESGSRPLHYQQMETEDILLWVGVVAVAVAIAGVTLVWITPLFESKMEKLIVLLSVAVVSLFVIRRPRGPLSEGPRVMVPPHSISSSPHALPSIHLHLVIPDMLVFFSTWLPSIHRALGEAHLTQLGYFEQINGCS